jgi:hypothetical protein
VVCVCGGVYVDEGGVHQPSSTNLLCPQPTPLNRPPSTAPNRPQPPPTPPLRIDNSYLFNVNRQWVIDARRRGNKLRFANHSTRPNGVARVTQVRFGGRWAVGWGRWALGLGGGSCIAYTQQTHTRIHIACPPKHAPTATPPGRRRPPRGHLCGRGHQKGGGAILQLQVRPGIRLGGVIGVVMTKRPLVVAAVSAAHSIDCHNHLKKLQRSLTADPFLAFHKP